MYGDLQVDGVVTNDLQIGAYSSGLSAKLRWTVGNAAIYGQDGGSWKGMRFLVNGTAEFDLYDGVYPSLFHRDLKVNKNLEVGQQVTAWAGSTSAPSFAFASNKKTGVMGHVDGKRIYTVIDGVWKTILYDSYFRIADDLQVEGQTKAQNGTKAKPAYSFTSDTKTGIYLENASSYPSNSIISITANGVNAANFGDKGVSLPTVEYKAGVGPKPCMVWTDS